MDTLLKFKTNINCNGCKATVTPFLDKTDGICHWDVDLENKDKILTVHSTGISAEEVKKVIKQAGYNSEFIEN